ncbi:MAG TPA: PA2169 family four-helix-bundle protein [Bryobacteraceae bacterium]|nr:PA2169 family four-helix-bundle protein [Bryobacteraceae bacterium]
MTLALRDHAFLSGLNESQFATLAKIAQPVQFGEHELILAAQQRSRDFYLLLSGSVAIELDTRLYAVRIQFLGPGDAFGWSALLEEGDTLFDVRTRERSTALRLDGARLSAALRKDPALAAELLKRVLHLVAARVHATEMCLGEFCGVRMRPTEHKVAGATIRTLNKLIEVCLDGELGYRTAAEHLHSSKLAIVFKDYSIRRAKYAKELRTEVERLGGIPTHTGSVAASLHRSWIALKSAISGGEAKAIIAACQAGEDAAHASYEAAINSDLMLSEIRSTVEAQWRAIDESRVWLREIHQELASGVSRYQDPNSVPDR